MLHGTDLQGWTPNNINIYTPITSVDSLIWYLDKKEGYKRVVHDDEGEYEVTTEYSQAIMAVVEMRGPWGQKVNIVYSAMPSALYLIPYFWGSYLANFVGTDHICITNPEDMFWGQIYLSPLCIWQPAQYCALQKYMECRFTVWGMDMQSGRGKGRGLEGNLNNECFFLIRSAWPSNLTLTMERGPCCWGRWGWQLCGDGQGGWWGYWKR